MGVGFSVSCKLLLICKKSDQGLKDDMELRKVLLYLARPTTSLILARMVSRQVRRCTAKSYARRLPRRILRKSGKTVECLAVAPNKGLPLKFQPEQAKEHQDHEGLASVRKDHRFSEVAGAGVGGMQGCDMVDESSGHKSSQPQIPCARGLTSKEGQVGL